METFYSILGIHEDASKDEIKKAYRKMALRYHPDKVHDLGEKIRMVAQIEFKRIKNAVDVLLDEEGKREI